MPTPEALSEHIETEVCIIGSGPAGLSVAHALVAAGRSVVVVEVGSATPRPADELLGQATCATDARIDLSGSRVSALGGTTTIWNTVRDGVPGAKYLPLDPLDLAPRPWLDVAGWPIPHETLVPWYHAAQELLQLGPFAYDADHRTAGEESLLQFAAGSLRSGTYRWGAAHTIATSLRAPLAKAAHAHVLGATRAATLVLNAAGDTVIAVRCIGEAGVVGTVRAQEIVLAAGAVENARLLLQLERPLSPSLGRGFMEHPIDRSLRCSSREPALSPTAGFYHFARSGRHRHLIGRIGLSSALQQTEQLANANLRLFPLPTSRVTRARRALAGILGRVPVTHYRVALDLEQLPDRENQIRLTNRRDHHGLQTAELAWRWSAGDALRHDRLRAVLMRELRHAGVALSSGPPSLDPNAHHHAGTTRMHATEREGVVSPELRVHGLTNVHVSGASVFPTAGAANPTLTIIALGLRLGARLAQR